MFFDLPKLNRRQKKFVKDNNIFISNGYAGMLRIGSGNELWWQYGSFGCSAMMVLDAGSPDFKKHFAVVNKDAQSKAINYIDSLMAKNGTCLPKSFMKVCSF